MAVPGVFWIELGLGIGLVLLSAKAHGRQIRLERELEGHLEVDFMKQNDPWVEALWRKDRRQFWITFPFAAGALSVLAYLSGLATVYGAEPLGSPSSGVLLVAGLLWGPTVAFVGNGITSLHRLRGRLEEARPQGRRRDEVRATRGPWLRDAGRGSYFLWGLVFGLGIVAVGLLVFG